VSGLRRWDALYRLILLAVAMQRVGELLHSRRNERRPAAALGTAGRRSYPLMVLLHTALFWLPLLERRIRPLRPRAWAVAPALVALSLATALRLWVIRSLGDSWNVRGRVHRDLVVVDSGPYRYVRHPNYVAVVVEMAALPLAGPAPISALLLSAANALVLVPRLRGEEQLLDRVPGYRERMGDKPRFLPDIPAILRRDDVPQSRSRSEPANDQASDLTVRIAKPPDIESIVALSGRVQDTLTATGSLQQIGPIPAATVAAHVAAGTSYVLNRSGQVIGSLFMEPVTDTPISPNLRSNFEAWQFDLTQPHWFLQRFMLAPEARGEGLGRLLLDTVVMGVAARGGGTVVLDCWAGNTKLRRYYHDAGFSLKRDWNTGEFEIAVFHKRIVPAVG
jgi:methyltransferase